MMTTHALLSAVDPLVCHAVLREWTIDLRALFSLWSDIEKESPPQSTEDQNQLMQRMEGVARFLGWSQTATLLVWLKHEWWVVANRPQFAQQTSEGIRNALSDQIAQFEAFETGEATLTDVDPAAALFVQLTEWWTSSPGLLSAPPSVFEMPSTRAGYDPQLMTLFLDEANRLIRDALARFASFLRNPSVEDFLPKLRRSFHTIKGSGRLAGAVRLGDYAWQIEQLLNQWLAEPRPSREMIQQTLALALPGIELLITELTPVDNSVDTAVDSAANIDDNPVRAIFLKEGHNCLATLQNSLREGARAEGGGEVSAELVRALHTLAGSAQIAGYGALGRLAKQLEELADIRLRNHQAATAVEWQLLVRGAEQLRWALDSGEVVDNSDDWVKREALEVAGAFTVPTDKLDLSRAFANEAMDVVDAIELCWEEETTPLAETGRLVRTYSLASQLESGARRAGWQGLADLAKALAEVCALELSPDNSTWVATQLREILSELLEGMVDIINRERTGQSLYASSALFDKLADIHNKADARSEKSEVPPLPFDKQPVTDQLPATDKQPAAEFLMELDDELEAPKSSVTNSIESENDDQLLTVFAEEAAELLSTTEMIIQQWIKAPQNSELLTELKRKLHTLKGSARMIDCLPMGNLAHRFESLLTVIPDSAAPAMQAYYELVEDIQVRLESMLFQLHQGEMPTEAQDLYDRIALSQTMAADDSTDDNIDDNTDDSAPQKSDLLSTESKQLVFDDNVRIKAERLDYLVNQTGEIGLYQIRTQQQINGWISHLQELDETIVRLHDQQRKLEIEAQNNILNRVNPSDRYSHEGEDEFDPLELDRFSTLEQYLKALAESITDLSNITFDLHQQSRQATVLMTSQSRSTTALQERLMSSRLVPFTSITPRMRRIVRQSAQELEKQAQLQVIGGEGELDRAVIEKIMPALEHMLRNALVHGIESPEVRVRAGKPEMGTVTVELLREGAEMLIRLSDDGAGIDLDVVREKAELQGWITSGTEISTQELTQFIFAPGFSTSLAVSRIAGRGVGMDVVHKAVGDLGGSLSLTNRTGQGTGFTIHLPFTLAIHQVLMISVGNEIYGLPLSSIERVVRLPQEAWCANKKSPTGIGVKWGQTTYNGIELRKLINSTEEESATKNGSLLLILLQGDVPYVLRVDALIGKREIVVKTLGPQVSSVPGILGGTLLETGRVALILDVLALIRYHCSKPAESRARKTTPRPSAPIRHFEVMIVDDSITVRQVTERLFQRQGFVTHTAKDGVDAISLLQKTTPDLIILDVEMPRLDGFELASYIRNTAAYKKIPIIMITSRVGMKHQERAQKIGVNAYMGKPYHESVLMEKARSLLGFQGG